ARQIVALDEFHYQRGDAAALFKPVDTRNVRMIERRKYFRLALEACKPVAIRCERRWQDLDRDLTLQLYIGRAKYLPHAAACRRSCGPSVCPNNNSDTASRNAVGVTGFS